MVGTSARKPRSGTVNKGKQLHSKNNVVGWQEHQLTHWPEVKGDMGRIKEEKAHTQAMLSLKKKWYAKKEDPRTHPRHKS